MGNRVAPIRYELQPDNLRGGLAWAVVPRVTDRSSGGTWKRCGFELVANRPNDHAGGAVIRGEPCGPALYDDVGGAVGFFGSGASPLPDQQPMSLFAFLTNRGSAAIQSLFGHRNGGSGWTFQLAYGGSQLGITRWGIADHPTAGLIVPSGGAHSCVGVSWANNTARFFLNGKFENLTIANPTSTSTTDQLLANGGSGAVTENCSVYVAHAWKNRALTDGDFLRLMYDPFLLVRPPELSMFAMFAGGGGGGGLARNWFY